MGPQQNRMKGVSPVKPSTEKGSEGLSSFLETDFTSVSGQTKIIIWSDSGCTLEVNVALWITYLEIIPRNI